MAHKQLPSALITRETFIHPDYVKIALSGPKMYLYASPDANEYSSDLVEVDMPQSARDRGVLPEGQSVDFKLDPSFLVKTLAKDGITNLNQLTQSSLNGYIASICNAENLKVIPTPLQKLHHLIMVEAKWDDEADSKPKAKQEKIEVQSDDKKKSAPPNVKKGDKKKATKNVKEDSGDEEDGDDDDSEDEDDSDENEDSDEDEEKDEDEDEDDAEEDGEEVVEDSDEEKSDSESDED